MTMILVLMVSPVCSSHANDKEGVQKFGYELYVEGKKIGSITVNPVKTEYQKQNVLKVETKTQIKVKALFTTLFSLESKGETVIGEKETLSYTSNAKIDGNSVSVVGQLKDGIFHFDIKEKSKTHTIEIKRSDYDFTDSDSIGEALQEGDSSKTFKILDLDRLEVVKHTLKWVRSEECNVGGEKTSCKVIEFSTPNKKGTRWISQDSFEILVKEEGVDKNGKYQIKISTSK